MHYGLSNEFPNLYTLKDIHQLFKDEYDNYGDLLKDVEDLGFQLAYVSDNQTLLYVRDEMLSVSTSSYQGVSNNVNDKNSQSSIRNRYGVHLDRNR